VKASYDVVVIGSGHNGLVAAAYLGLAGKSVLVLERNETIGGATASKKVFPDFDAYLSTYSYLISLFPQRIIDDLGLTFRTAQRQTASFTPYSERAGLVLSNIDESRSRNSMFEMTGSDDAWNAYQKLMSLESALAKVVWPSFLEPLKAKANFMDALDSEEEREAWKSFIEEPLGRVIEKYAQHDALRGLLMTDGKIGVFTEPDDPTLIQNRCFLYHIVGGGTGEWRVPVGGMRALVDSLMAACRRGNVEFATSSPATHIEVGSDQHVVTYEVEGKTHAVQCEHVLLNAGPKTQARLLGESWLPEPANEGSVIKINMLLRRLPKVKAQGVTPQEAFAGSFHIDEGYEQMRASHRSASDGQIPNPAPGEMYCHTLTDPSILSPELQKQGYQTLTLFGLDMPYRLFEQDHDARRAEVLELYLAGLDRICDEPFKECLAVAANGSPCIEIKTPQDIEREVDLDQGNIFQTAPSWFFAESSEEVGTWGVETQYPGILRAGSSAKRGGAVSGIPGFCAAQCILSDGI